MRRGSGALSPATHAHSTSHSQTYTTTFIHPWAPFPDGTRTRADLAVVAERVLILPSITLPSAPRRHTHTSMARRRFLPLKKSSPFELDLCPLEERRITSDLLITYRILNHEYGEELFGIYELSDDSRLREALLEVLLDRDDVLPVGQRLVYDWSLLEGRFALSAVPSQNGDRSLIVLSSGNSSAARSSRRSFKRQLARKFFHAFSESAIRRRTGRQFLCSQCVVPAEDDFQIFLPELEGRRQDGDVGQKPNKVVSSSPLLNLKLNREPCKDGVRGLPTLKFQMAREVM
ncbi:hypothetical protein GEV33_014374 [Tenebrio molitor]|uniref:Uncharacterized protein n=1 Tax=Tenebrio molitor TaxID=7067 RepID=A0A8J6LCY5_TENMO|nr:hypothetical protein GEV33_014374 [Tenebrio molitor]